MNISWYCFATFTFAIIFISVTALSDVDQTQLECKDMDGEIKLFIFREKTKKNKDCDWIEKHFKRWCTVEIVRNHCIKLCNNCPFSPPPRTFWSYSCQIVVYYLEWIRCFCRGRNGFRTSWVSQLFRGGEEKRKKNAKCHWRICDK